MDAGRRPIAFLETITASSSLTVDREEEPVISNRVASDAANLDGERGERARARVEARRNS